MGHRLIYSRVSSKSRPLSLLSPPFRFFSLQARIALAKTVRQSRLFTAMRMDVVMVSSKFREREEEAAACELPLQRNSGADCPVLER